MQNGDVIALFPVNMVLFPHMAVPLHIFEERHRLMIDHCLEHNASFGVVLIRSREEGGGRDQPYEVGTLARIGNLQRMEDGRMQLLAVGQERFRVRRLLPDTLPYLEAVVEPWCEHPIESDESYRLLAQELSTAFEHYLRSVLESHGLQMKRLTLPEDPVCLSFVVAASLQTSLAFKQYLLELQDTSERLRLLLKVLDEYMRLPRIQAFEPQNWDSYCSRN